MPGDNPTTDQPIHWAAYDSETGALVAWDTAISLAWAVDQITKTLRDHTGGLAIRQLGEPLDVTGERALSMPTEQERACSRIHNAASQLREALTVETASALSADQREAARYGLCQMLEHIKQ